MNCALFSKITALAGRRSFRRSIDVWGRASRWPLPVELVESYRRESLDRIFDILTVGSRSALLHEDPNGTSALMELRSCRRGVRRLKRRGLPVRHRLLESSRGLAPRRYHVTSPAQRASNLRAKSRTGVST